ncbi:MAG: FAD-dependent thymidylate synthase [Patescibacteria group bacterium]|nr:FAD-dependent thymidylate synthase [Patescibacteria group bacterium]
MKILKNAGSFIILTPEKELKEQLLRIEEGGRTCYQSKKDEINEETAKKFIQMILKRGHESVIEHSNMTVQFNNVSRGFTHELVRHRLCAFSQESTRYVDYSKKGEGVDLKKFQVKFVVPPHKNENEKVKLEDGKEMSMTDMFNECENFYRSLRKAGWSPQDARQILPIGTKSQIIVSANFRQWRHIFSLRTDRAAHWEIRKIMCDLLKHIQKIVPVIFDDFVYKGVDQDNVSYFKKTALR